MASGVYMKFFYHLTLLSCFWTHLYIYMIPRNHKSKLSNQFSKRLDWKMWPLECLRLFWPGDVFVTLHDLNIKKRQEITKAVRLYTCMMIGYLKCLKVFSMFWPRPRFWLQMTFIWREPRGKHKKTRYVND